ncbi:MAG: hypothetical protein KF787_10905 [Phycisphaeraceae bacterium]|nr:hypothetical protein [Phycisphaerae bacterium]MBX3393144.1 hypothetical protein [Phycisphaeraceae bacterium]
MNHLMAFRARIASGLLVVLGFHGLVLAQPRTTEVGGRDVSEWFDRAWRAALEFPSFREVSFAWRSEDLEAPTAAQIEALRRETARHPEHPERANLPRYLRHSSGKPTVHRHVLFSRGEGLWRYNTTFDDGSFGDSAIGPSEGWRMSGTTLKRMSRAEAMGDDPEQALVLHEREFVSPVGMLLHGYLSVGRTAGLKPGPVSVSGSTWSVRLSTPAEKPEDQAIVLDVSGRWAATEGRGFVERVVIASNGYKPESAGRQFRLRDWKYVEGLGTHVASRVDEYQPDGALVRSLVFEGCDPLPSGGFEAVTAPPWLPGTDAVRGPIDIRFVGDYRTGEIREYSGGAPVATYEMEEGEWSERRAFRDRLRWAGWAMIVAVVAGGFGVVRYRGVLRN